MALQLSEYINTFFPKHITNTNVWETIKKHDCSVYNSCNLAVSIYRIQNIIKDASEIGESLEILSLIQKQLCCCEIYYTAEIGDNFLLVHGLGTVIGSGVRVGKNVTVYQNVTLGTKYDTEKPKCTIKDDVIIYAGAKILGDITIGKGSVIGANSLVISDVGENEIYAGVPAKLIGKVTNSKYKLPAGTK